MLHLYPFHICAHVTCYMLHLYPLHTSVISDLLHSISASFHICVIPYLRHSISASFHICSIPHLLHSTSPSFHICSIPDLFHSRSASFHICSIPHLRSFHICTHFTSVPTQQERAIAANSFAKRRFRGHGCKMQDANCIDPVPSELARLSIRIRARPAVNSQRRHRAAPRSSLATHRRRPPARRAPLAPVHRARWS